MGVGDGNGEYVGARGIVSNCYLNFIFRGTIQRLKIGGWNLGTLARLNVCKLEGWLGAWTMQDAGCRMQDRGLGICSSIVI